MKTTKILVLAVLIIGFVFSPAIIRLAAQQVTTTQSEPGVNEGEMLADIIISKFEDAESWSGQMPIDQGSIYLMKRFGKPNAIPQVDPTTNIENKYVLGVKVQFNKRGFNRFVVKPPRPIKIPGITKSISLWVVGRNYQHTLYFLVKDFFNQDKMLPVSQLNFLGWKRLTYMVPPTIAQDEYHYTDLEGITFVGIVVETNPAESYGTFYTYLDEMMARTNVFNMSTQDKDDMIDNW